ncbi:hypothetical protein GCM10027034_36180 [Ramlibacter solisilvae]|uniref:Uncharacterized protein n=1 Tax=Ramlibacter tataouinensis TaxID=94132 RepID=A0A127K042_9BURK|nr:hypothetical protein [Ramlibacter tataouinensis]AMO23762.1 hypothetical protein UC35_13885 [Ramlibacter tataouinensis]
MAGDDSFFDRVLSRLFGKDDEGEDADQQLVAELTDAIVDTVEPRVKAHRHYRRELKDCVRATVAWLREIGRMPIDHVLLARASWGSDPRLNTFFGAPDAITEFLGRSRELRAYFDDPANAGVREAFALLGMSKEEKTFLGPRYEDGMLKQDVAQTSVNFNGHRLFALAPTEAQTRVELGRRIVQRLSEVTLSRIMEIDRKGLNLEQQKSLLGTRLRMLKLARDGVPGLVDDPGTVEQQIREVQRQLDERVKDFIEAKSSLATLDGYIEQIREVFAHPEQHVVLTRSELDVTRMNVKADEGTEEPHRTLTLAELQVGGRQPAVIAFVRCLRSELPPKEDLLAKAERFL